MRTSAARSASARRMSPVRSAARHVAEPHRRQRPPPISHDVDLVCGQPRDLWPERPHLKHSSGGSTASRARQT
ncbi:hypothetical protein FOA52_016306 [Chlamydomonas sp. UWO 241]|nr:hypothetical protein FOA52_016306 [Chlamydomonas sp. UWO 241]